jgi:hypothetical protein
MLKNIQYMEDVGGGMVQPTTMEMDNGKYIPYKNYGIVIPKKRVRDCLLRIQRGGLDERGVRG